MVRAGFTLIELIFAIVVIAVLVAGVPRIIAQNDVAVESSLVQDGISAVAGTSSAILSFAWDASSANAADPLDYAKVVDNTGSLGRKVVNLPSGAGTVAVILPLRAGHINQENHRRFHSANAPVTAGAIANIGAIQTTLSSAASAHGYKSAYSIAIAPGYVPDGAANITGAGSTISYNFSDTQVTGPTNMKTAEIKLSSSTAANIVTMRVYAANIGEIDFQKRTF